MSDIAELMTGNGQELVSSFHHELCAAIPSWEYQWQRFESTSSNGVPFTSPTNSMWFGPWRSQFPPPGWTQRDALSDIAAVAAMDWSTIPTYAPNMGATLPYNSVGPVYIEPPVPMTLPAEESWGPEHIVHFWWPNSGFNNYSLFASQILPPRLTEWFNKTYQGVPMPVAPYPYFSSIVAFGPNANLGILFSSYWIYNPYVCDDPYQYWHPQGNGASLRQFKNVTAATRGRWRNLKRQKGWLASAEIWVKDSNGKYGWDLTDVTFNDGTTGTFNVGRCRDIVIRNPMFIRNIDLQAGTWYEVPQVTDASYAAPSTAGFVGRINFANLWESWEGFLSRNGLTPQNSAARSSSETTRSSSEEQRSSDE